MTLAEAILKVQEEYDAELQAMGPSEHLVLGLMHHHEYKANVETALYRELAPLVRQVPFADFVSIVLRLGMRVQRKLDNPDKPTSGLDVSYSGWPPEAKETD